MWCLCEKKIGEQPSGDKSRNAHCGRGDRKSPKFNQRDPEGREHHPADAGSIVSSCERGGPRAHKPRRNNLVERGSPGSSPACSTEQRRGEELPRLLCFRPADNAKRQGKRSGFGNCGDAEPTIKPREVRHHDSANQEVRRDRQRNLYQRPAALLLHGVEVHRRPVKAEAPPEYGQQKRSCNDAPPKKAKACARRHSPVR